MLAAGLDAYFDDWTQDKFFILLAQEFGDATRLQSFASQPNRTHSMVHGPQLIAHIAPGNLPVPVFQSIAFGLLLRSAQFVKCASGKSLLPRLFGHSLHTVEPGLAASLEIAEWRGGNESLESALFAEADCVVASGSDDTIHATRQRLPLAKRLVGYGHRVSFGYVEKLACEVMGTQAILTHAADDVIAWNQHGCLSPHVIYVEENGSLNPARFAEMLAGELEARNETMPRGPISTRESAAISTARRFYKIRAANNAGATLWESEGSTDWTVVHEDEKQFQTSPLNRFIFVKPIKHIDEVLHVLEPIRESV
ncbi:MAG: acyl-CoA reductase, partial [Verrucomicrobiota bacterium]|nr:acyl-CoA reductase [Verrucomicrobiota bacterium]